MSGPRHRNWAACQCSMCRDFRDSQGFSRYSDVPRIHCPPPETRVPAYILETLTEAGLD